MDYIQSPLLLDILKPVVIVTIVLVVMLLIAYFVKKVIKTKNNRPWLIKGSKNAKNSQVISQDPRNENSITLYRSDNESGGSVFSYSFWFVIENMEYKYGEWKHIFHKGNKTSNPNRAPGVWIHPDKNSIRVYMNTMKNYLDHVDIDNIPIKRWVCCIIVLNGQYLDIYINGHLKKRKELDGVAKQNFGDLWVNLYGGYDGYLSNLRYYRKSLDFGDIQEIVKEGPSKLPSLDTHKYPPYLDDSWWFDI